MRKLLAILLATVFMLSALAIAEVSKDDYTPFEQPVVIACLRGDGYEGYGLGDPDWVSPEDNKWINTIRDYLNVEFDNTWLMTGESATGTATQWDLAIANGTLPMCGTVNSKQYEELLAAGLLVDMSDLYDEYASDTVHELCDDSPEMAYMTRGGKLYGLPVVSPSYGTYGMLHIRKDWMDAVGATEYPTTIEDVIQLGQEFVDAGLCKYILCLGNEAGTNMGATWGTIQGWMTGYGVAWKSNCWVPDEDSGRIIYGATDPRVADALLGLQDLYTAGLIREDYISTPANESFNAEEAGLIYGINWGAVRAVDLYALDTEGKVEIIAVDAPTIDGEKPIYWDSAVPSSFFVVTTTANEEQQKAIMLAYDLTQQLFADFDYDWGYRRAASPVCAQCESAWQRVIYYADIEYAYRTGDTTKFNTANAKTYYDRLVAFEAGDRSLGKYEAIYRVPDGTYGVMYRAMQEGRMNNTVYVAPPTETMNEKRGLLDTLLLDAANKVIMGADIQVWYDAVDEWYANGGQTMTDEVNAWYDAL